MTNESVAVVFNGFLNLLGKEKLALVELINEYFDSNERESIRAEHDRRFEATQIDEIRCPCCGRDSRSLELR